MAPRDTGYDAFISYSHALGGALAQALRVGLERFAKPWYRVRALRIFHDTASLSANPALWSSIEAALASSRWLVLMASPDAAASVWVDREVQWWIANRSTDRLLVVLSAGELSWDGGAGDFDWQRTTALPPALRGAFAEEPRWIDLRWLTDADHVSQANPRFRECVADVAAAIHGVPKDAIVGEHVRQHRRTRRLAAGAISALVVLLIATLVGAVVALNQRNRAQDQARIATARELAATANTLLSTHLDLAQLFAAQAYKMDADPQTRATLFQSVAASPALVRYLPAGAPVSAVAPAAYGAVAAAGTATGRVFRWQLKDGARTELAHLRAKILSVAASADGNTIAAADGFSAVSWTNGGAAQPIPVPPGESPDATVVSPSGRYVVVLSLPPPPNPSDEPGALTLVDTRARRVTNVVLSARGAHRVFSGVTYKLDMPTDGELTMFGADGSWVLRSVPGLAERQRASVDFGAHSAAEAVSRGGAFIGYTNGGPEILIWRASQVAGSLSNPILTAQEPGTNPEALAISGDGRWAAIADTGTIYVSETTSGRSTTGVPIALTGNASVATDGLTFTGDDNHLLSASENSVVYWDLSQLSRIGSRASMTVPSACNGCSGPRVAVRPDGAAVASVDGDGISAVVHSLTSPSGSEAVFRSGSYGRPAWSADGRRLFLPTSAGGEVRGLAASFPPFSRWPSFRPQAEPPAAAGLTAGGRRIVVIDDQGDVLVRDASTGQVVRSIRGPSDFKSGIFSEYGAAIDPTGARAAVLAYIPNAAGVNEASTVRVIDVSTGTTRAVAGGSASGVAFAADQLLIRRPTGTLEVWDAAGRHRRRVLGGEQSYVKGPVASADGSLAAEQRSDGVVVVTDLRAGAVLASIQLPAAPRSGLAFAPDGHRLITVSEPAGRIGDRGQLQQWNLSPAGWAKAACTAAGRQVTAAEWRQYIGSNPPGSMAC